MIQTPTISPVTLTFLVSYMFIPSWVIVCHYLGVFLRFFQFPQGYTDDFSFQWKQREKNWNYLLRERHKSFTISCTHTSVLRERAILWAGYNLMTHFNHWLHLDTLVLPGNITLICDEPELSAISNDLPFIPTVNFLNGVRLDRESFNITNTVTIEEI